MGFMDKLTKKRSAKKVTDEVSDVVVVGGGSAGSVIAARLTEDKNTRVLVLEAGRPDSLWDLFIHMPSGFSFPIGAKNYDWMYESDPEPEMNGRRVYHARGKVLGGSSSINGMIYQRGNPMDYEKWGQNPGMENWDFAHCLPYFNRMETAAAAEPNDPRRGHDGPLYLSRGPATSELFQALFKSVQEAGYNLTNDVNGYRQEGFAPFDRNIKNGKRWSAARAYLYPNMDRENLEIRTRAFTTKILFEGQKAVGVEYEWQGGVHRVYAEKIVLSAGAINTPQLLEISGIGDREILEKHGIDVEIRNFTEYTQPNPALDNGDIDMNWFQHIAYLADYNQASGKDLTLIGTTEIIPLPLYSKKYKDVSEFKKGDTVAIPNDTVNQARAINVLVAAGLLKLSNETIRPEPKDIDEAASTVKVQTVAAQQTVNALESVQGSVINNTFSADAGIDTNTALFKDDPKADSAKPFVNGFAVRREDRDNETYKKIAALYHEQAVLDESAKLSSGTSVPVQLDAAQIDETLKQYQDAIAKQGA